MFLTRFNWPEQTWTLLEECCLTSFQVKRIFPTEPSLTSDPGNNADNNVVQAELHCHVTDRLFFPVHAFH